MQEMRKTIRKSCVLLCPLLPVSRVGYGLHRLVFLHIWNTCSHVFHLQTNTQIFGN